MPIPTCFQLPLFPTLRPTRSSALCRRPTMMCAGSDASTTGPYELGVGEIAVKFINLPDNGGEIIAVAEEGDALFRVGDAVGARIPRACRSGLCGSCTVDILGLGEKQTVRACQTVVVPPSEGQELIVDMARAKTARRAGKDPMARFENMDTEYVAGAAPKSRKGWIAEQQCKNCEASGDVICYYCEGTGQEDDDEYLCALCAGSGWLRCAECQGKGVINVKR